jgi:hypothetical protein
VRKDRRQRSEGIHPVRRREHLHVTDDDLGQGPRHRELRLQIAQLRARRQAAVPEQVAGLLEGRVARQIVNVVSAIRQHAAIAVQVTDA